MTMEIGSLVVAKLDTGVCRFGEVGVCYETYQLDGRPGWSVIFQRGGYDGFSPDDVAMMLHVLGPTAAGVADYQFRNVGQLQHDYERGRFADAFALYQTGAAGWA